MLGIENQSEIHYAMPVRVMLEDAMQYTMQIRRIEKLHQKDGSKPTGAEFLSGFHQDDRLIPVITLTVYFGSKKWTDPTDLHGMLDASPEILKHLPNYWLNLIDPSAIDELDFRKFHTELKNVLKYVKHSSITVVKNEISNGRQKQSIDAAISILWIVSERKNQSMQDRQSQL